MIPKEWFKKAASDIKPFIVNTPVTYDGSYSMFLKWESAQVTGSFKVRGALNKIINLQNWERNKGLITASAGNHGQGLAYAGQLFQAKTTIFVSISASTYKIQKMMDYGASIHKIAGGYANAERAGKMYSETTGGTWVSPYNDGHVIAGQGTLAAEITAEIPHADKAVWVVPVGGGGLISGIVSFLASYQYDPRIIGVQAAASPYFYSLFKYGHQKNIDEQVTLADGLAGEIEGDSVTIPIVCKCVDDIVLVSEAEIVEAMTYAWEYIGEPIEPSGAVGLAAVLSGKISHKPRIVIISGGNISPEQHLNLIRLQ